MNKSTNKLYEEGDLSTITTYQAGVKQAAVHRSLQRLCDEALQPFGISKSQWFVLGTVWDSGEHGTRTTDLASALDTTMAYLTGTLNFLETKGMVERIDHVSDSRSKLIRVPKAMEGRMTGMESALRLKLRQSIYAEVDPTEFRTYMKVMYQLAEVADED